MMESLSEWIGMKRHGLRWKRSSDPSGEKQSGRCKNAGSGLRTWCGNLFTRSSVSPKVFSSVGLEESIQPESAKKAVSREGREQKPAGMQLSVQLVGEPQEDLTRQTTPEASSDSVIPSEASDSPTKEESRSSFTWPESPSKRPARSTISRASRGGSVGSATPFKFMMADGGKAKSPKSPGLRPSVAGDSEVAVNASPFQNESTETTASGLGKSLAIEDGEVEQTSPQPPPNEKPPAADDVEKSPLPPVPGEARQPKDDVEMPWGQTQSAPAKPNMRAIVKKMRKAAQAEEEPDSPRSIGSSGSGKPSFVAIAQQLSKGSEFGMKRSQSSKLQTPGGFGNDDYSDRRSARNAIATGRSSVMHSSGGSYGRGGELGARRVRASVVATGKRLESSYDVGHKQTLRSMQGEIWR